MGEERDTLNEQREKRLARNLEDPWPILTTLCKLGEGVAGPPVAKIKACGADVQSASSAEMLQLELKKADWDGMKEGCQTTGISPARNGLTVQCSCKASGMQKAVVLLSWLLVGAHAVVSSRPELCSLH